MINKKIVLFVLLIMTLNSCSYCQSLSKKEIVWEYRKCEAGSPIETISYLSENDKIRIPIFPHPIPLMVLDSLWDKAAKDSSGALSKKYIDFTTNGYIYSFSNSNISLAITDYYQIDSADGSFCVRVIVSEKKYDLSEHFIYKMIYVPNVGVIYVLKPTFDDPFETKVARVIKQPGLKKSEMLKLYNKVFRFLMAECF